MLRSVEIYNYRSCKQTSFNLETPLGALCGPNGVGKSNVLNAIAWACSTAIIAESVRLQTQVDILRRGFGVSVTLGLDIDGCRYRYQFVTPSVQRGTGNDAPGGIVEMLDVEETGGPTRVFALLVGEVEVMGRSEKIRLPKLIPGLAALSSLLADDDPAASHINRVRSFFNRVQYYPLDDMVTEKDFVYEQEYNDWKFRYQAEGVLTSSVAMRWLYMQEEEPDLLAELRALLGEGGLNVVERIEVARLQNSTEGTTGESMPRSKLFMPIVDPSSHMAGAESTFRLSQLSLGTRRIIQIVTSMLFDRRSLMLMEQPEDSIHPGLLRKLIDLLRTYSSDTQMLFTTHSPAVLDILEPEEVLLATAVEGSTEVRRLSPDEMERAREFLESEGTLSDFLEAQDDL